MAHDVAAEPTAGAHTGHAPPLDAATRAAAALGLVATDPSTALRLADDLLGQISVRDPGPDLLSAAAAADRAAGLALRELGLPVPAETRLRRAVRRARRAGDAVTEAEAWMSLAYVLLERGRMRAALAATDRAAPALRGLPAARLRAQRALVLQRCGRDDEALAEYAAALPALRRGGDDVWESRLRNNRALLRAYRGDIAGALDDLRRAHTLDDAAGRRAAAADRLCNVAWLLGISGSIPEALATFDEVERTSADVAPPERWVDRAEVLLRAGLVDDAHAVAAAAVRWLADRGWEALSAEATLQLARARLRDGDVDGAAVAAGDASRRFRGQGRRGWQLLAVEIDTRARLQQLLPSPDQPPSPAASTHTAPSPAAPTHTAPSPAALQHTAPAPTTGRPAPGSSTGRSLRTVRRELRRAVDVAVELERHGWRSRGADLRLAVAAAAQRYSEAALAAMALRPVADDASAAGPLDSARRLFARALLDPEPGRRLRRLRAAWRHAEEERAAVGATELRAVAAPLALDVVDVAVATVWRRPPRELFEWAERGRAAVLRQPAVAPPADAEVAAALGEVRLAARAEAEARLSGMADHAAAARRAVLERRVVSLTRHAAGAAGVEPVAAGAVHERLADETFVQFVSHGDALAALVLRGGRTRRYPLGRQSDAVAAVSSAGFSLRRAASGFGAAATAMARATSAAAQLDEALLAPLRSALGDGQLVVCPTSGLVGVPWSLLPTCAGRPVSVAPSATSWAAARDARAGRRDSLGRVRGAVLCVAGPGLPAAREEARQVADRYDDAVVLVDGGATTQAVLAALPDAGVAHCATHGRLRADNPLFSALELADGPLTGYDIERLPRVPTTMLLPACRSGEGALGGGDVLGLAWTLLGAGASSVVAAIGPVADDTTCELMIAVHDRLAAGSSPAVALAAAQHAAVADDPVGRAVAAAFVCFGA